MENYIAKSDNVQFRDVHIIPGAQIPLAYSNNFIYVNQDARNVQTVNVSQKVLINPHFQSNKVFVNPHFCGTAANNSIRPSIHVNPRLKTGVSIQAEKKPTLISSKPENVSAAFRPNAQVHINPKAKSQSIYINPRFSDGPAKSELVTCKAKPSCVNTEPTNRTVFLSKTKLIRTAHIQSNQVVKRRNSIKSKYKIVKSNLSPKLATTRHVSCKTKFKLNNTGRKPWNIVNTQGKKIFVKTTNIIRNKKDQALVNISGIIFKKSRNSIRRASISTVKDVTKKKVSAYKPIQKASAKNVIEARRSVVKKYKIIRKQSLSKGSVAKIAARKLRKCNIPCPSYRKYGACKGKDNGKCSWKHDPDQIALCTRFLQGACIKEKCLLSHNVSPEKMPTCKYFLEGACSKDSCPYLHVKISSKAEVCRDFLEGFCRKADQCDKRHQYLCPDYEKHGSCLRQRCAYPHGKMVRTYFFNKNTFVKKCSEVQNCNSKSSIVSKPSCKAETNTDQCKEKKRYYVEKRSVGAHSNEDNGGNENKNDNIALQNFVGLHERPKLGSLPSFIPFGES